MKIDPRKLSQTFRYTRFILLDGTNIYRRNPSRARKYSWFSQPDVQEPLISMASDFKNEITRKIAGFLVDIGLEVSQFQISSPTFLPGIQIEDGKLLVDEDKLIYPGDLLHEAGHLALAASDVRSHLCGEVVLPDVLMEAIEAQAMAWSYAAVLHLGLDPQVVFHEGGYRGASKGLLRNFELGAYIGVHGLQDAGLTAVGEKAKALAVEPYPYMYKWLRD